jgi:hypothetical protein
MFFDIEIIERTISQVAFFKPYREHEAVALEPMQAQKFAALKNNFVHYRIRKAGHAQVTINKPAVNKFKTVEIRGGEVTVLENTLFIFRHGQFMLPGIYLFVGLLKKILHY